MLILYPQGGVITMPQDKRNIYKIAREAKGLTQEAAAEKLGISDSFTKSQIFRLCALHNLRYSRKIRLTISKNEIMI